MKKSEILFELLLKGGIPCCIICGIAQYFFSGTLRHFFEAMALIGLLAFAIGVIWYVLFIVLHLGGKAADKVKLNKNRAELDAIFDNWIAQNGGFWIIKCGKNDDLILIRRNGTEAVFNLEDYGFANNRSYLSHLAKRYNAEKVYKESYISGRGYSGTVSSNGSISISQDGGTITYLDRILSKEAAKESERVAAEKRNKYKSV